MTAASTTAIGRMMVEPSALSVQGCEASIGYVRPMLERIGTTVIGGTSLT
jgi:hypothetical protein